MDDEGVVDVDEEGELGAVRERRDVGPLQLHRQLLVGLRSLKRAIVALTRFNRFSFYPGLILTQRQPMILHHVTFCGLTNDFFVSAISWVLLFWVCYVSFLKPT